MSIDGIRILFEECLTELTAKFGSLEMAGIPARAEGLTALPAVPRKGAFNVAVLDPESGELSANERVTLANKLRSELISTGIFKVMEREQMVSILNEQGFQQMVCADDACMVKVGQLIGVEQLVVGHVGRVGDVFLVTLRIIDVAHGNILASVDQEVEGSMSDVLMSGIRRVAEKLARNVKSALQSNPGQ